MPIYDTDVELRGYPAKEKILLVNAMLKEKEPAFDGEEGG
jgi:hypothetical protein